MGCISHSIACFAQTALGIDSALYRGQVTASSPAPSGQVGICVLDLGLGGAAMLIFTKLGQNVPS